MNIVVADMIAAVWDRYRQLCMIHEDAVPLAWVEYATLYPERAKLLVDDGEAVLRKHIAKKVDVEVAKSTAVARNLNLTPEHYREFCIAEAAASAMHRVLDPIPTSGEDQWAET